MAAERLADRFGSLDDANTRGKALNYCQVILINGYATVETVVEAANFVQQLYGLKVFDGRDGIKSLRETVRHWVTAVNALSSNKKEQMRELYNQYVLDEKINRGVIVSDIITVQGLKRAFHHLCCYWLVKDEGKSPDFLDGRLFDCHTVVRKMGSEVEDSDIKNWRFDSTDLTKGKTLLLDIQLKILQDRAVKRPRAYLNSLKLITW